VRQQSEKTTKLAKAKTPSRRSTRRKEESESDGDDEEAASSSGSDVEVVSTRPARGTRARSAAGTTTATRTAGKRGASKTISSPIKAAKGKGACKNTAGPSTASASGVKWYDSYEFNGDEYR
jgi:hypothetical protein